MCGSFYSTFKTSFKPYACYKKNRFPCFHRPTRPIQGNVPFNWIKVASIYNTHISTQWLLNQMVLWSFSSKYKTRLTNKRTNTNQTFLIILIITLSRTFNFYFNFTQYSHHYHHHVNLHEKLSHEQFFSTLMNVKTEVHKGLELPSYK